MQELQKSILKTLVWFDIFDYPLELEEIKKFFLSDSLNQQFNSADDFDIEEIKKLRNKERIEKKENFYFLPNREEIIEIRKQRKQISLKKIKKAKRLVKLLKFIPSIKAIFLCNSVGYLNAEENSDIDLFVIAAPGRIWTARWWSVGWLKLLNLRPRRKNKKDKFCLSYFIIADNLNLEHTKISENDISLVYWLTSFQPLYFKNDLWNKFIKANEWIKRYLVNFTFAPQGVLAEGLNVSERTPQRAGKANLNKRGFINLQEKILKKIQLWYMPKELKQASKNNNNKVIINDKMLKFHLNDKRQEDFCKWEEKLKRIMNYEL